MPGTGFLGYHPDRVTALRRALASALAEAAGIRDDDPLAVDATAGWRAAQQRLAPWEARLVSLLACAFDTPYRRVSVDTDLPVDYLRPLDRRWSVVADPMVGPLPAPDLAARAGELAALLLAADPALLADADDARRLAELVAAVLADDTAGAVLLAELGVDGIAAVVTALARLAVGPDPSGAMAGARSVLQAFAVGLGAAVRDGRLDGDALADAVFDGPGLDGPGLDRHGGDPHVAALLLREAGFPTAVTVAWAERLVAAAGTVDPGGLGTLVQAPGEGTAELVLEALTADPLAGRLVIGALDDLDRLLGPHVDGDIAGRFLLAIADPVAFDASATAALVAKVLDDLGAHHALAEGLDGGRPLHDWLGPFVGPSLPTLVAGTGLAAHADGLRWVAESNAAAQAMVGWLLVHAQGLARLAPEERATQASGIGAALTLVAQGRVDRAAHEHDGYERVVDVSRFVVGKGLGAAAATTFGPPGELAGAAIAAAADLAVGKAFEALDAVGWWEEPADAAQATPGIEAGVQHWQVGVVATALRASRPPGLSAGPSAPPPPADDDDLESYRARVERWAREDPGRRPDADLAADVTAGLLRGRASSRLVIDGTDPVPPFPDRPPGLDGPLRTGARAAVGG